MAQAAVAQYNLRNFDDAQELFEDLIERDPHRVEVRLILRAMLMVQYACMSAPKQFTRITELCCICCLDSHGQSGVSLPCSNWLQVWLAKHAAVSWLEPDACKICLRLDFLVLAQHQGMVLRYRAI